MMKLDLERAGVRSIVLDGHLTLTESIVKSLDELGPSDKEGDRFFLDQGEDSGKTRHFVAVLLAPKKKGDVRSHLILSFDIGHRTKTEKKKYPDISSLLRVLSSVSEPIRFNCHVNLRLDPKKRALIVNLPIKLFNSPNVPFDVIRGFHVVKSTGDKLDVIVDLEDDGAVGVGATFDHEGRVDSQLPDSVLRRATQIADMLSTRIGS